MDLILNKLYKTIPLDIRRHRFTQLIVPTETVIRSLTPPIPTFARAYSTDLYVPFETSDILNYSELANRFSNKGSWHGTYGVSVPVLLLEYFEDCGDDGHTVYSLEGWVLVREPELKPDFYLDRENPLMRKLQIECWKDDAAT